MTNCSCKICAEFGAGMCAKIEATRPHGPHSAQPAENYRPYSDKTVWNRMEPALYEKFLSTLERVGLLRIAADAVGVKVNRIQDYRREHPEFDEMVIDAIGRHADNCVARIQSIALDGTKKPLIGGKDRDQIVAYETRHPERLLELFLLKHDSSYNPKQTVSVEQQPSSDMRVDFPFHSMSKKARYALRLLLEVLAEEQDDKVIKGE